MLTKLFILNLALLIRVQCNNLYVYPKTVHVINGNKVIISCTDSFDDQATAFSKEIVWVKLNSSLVISDHPRARVRRDGHQLLFDSASYSDDGLYCCKFPAENHGCTSSSTVRVIVAARKAHSLATTLESPIADHNVVAKSTQSGTTSWRLEANPRHRCVLLGRGATINCLNNSVSFAHNIQWFKITTDGGLELISHSLQERRVSNAHQLQFKSTIAEDEGLYCCKAFSQIECAPTAITNITISLPPVIYPLQNHTVKIGETIVINCTVTNGDPNKFFWQQYGKDIPTNDPKYSVVKSNNTITLTINNATTMDQGYYSCIARNKKYQHDNESLYLHVQLPLDCSMISTPYSITIGLTTTTKNCSSIEEATLYSVVNEFLQSLCNCSNYCMTLEISCSINDAIATVVVTLKEKEPLNLSRLVYSTLKGRQVNVQNYSILCVVKTLCEEPSTPTPTITYILNDTSGKEDTDENNIIISPIGIAITVIIVMMLLLLIILVIVAILLRLCNKKQRSKSATKPERKLETGTHDATPDQPANSTQFFLNERPSTSSNDTGFSSLPDTGSSVSDAADDLFSSNMTQSTENNPTTSSNPADRSSMNPSSVNNDKHNVVTTNQSNSASKHHRNIQLPNEPVKWKENETYCRLDPCKPPHAYVSPATISKPSVTGEVKTHYYDDIEGINESRRIAAIAAATSYMHDNKKHTQSRSHGNHIPTQNSQPTHSNHNVSAVRNVTVSASKGKLLHITNSKHSSLSQV